MSWWIIPVVLAVVALFWVSYRLESASLKRDAERLQSRFDSRPPMATDEFIERYDVPISEDLVERVLRVLALVGERSAEPGEVRIDPAKIDPDDHASDIGFDLDSLAHLEMLIELEKEFDVPFRFREFKNAERVRDMVRVVANRLASKPNPPSLDPDFEPIP